MAQYGQMNALPVGTISPNASQFRKPCSRANFQLKYGTETMNPTK
jgi:hypothetical protein